MLLHHQLLESVKIQSDKAALVVRDEQYSYSKIGDSAEKLGSFMQNQGIRSGDRIAIFTNNTAEMVISIYAVLYVGAVFIPINPQTKSEKLTHILNDSQPTALISEVCLKTIYESALERNSSVKICIIVDSEGTDSLKSKNFFSFSKAISIVNDTIRLPQKIDQDLAAIIYTSGSTGNPKGVMLTHLNMITAVNSISSYLELQDNDRIMCALPLSFDYGLYQILMAFKKGASVVLERSFLYPAKILEKMAQERVTVFPGVPTMFSMLQGTGITNKFDLSALRSITNTAASLTETHINGLREMFPRVKIFSMYGLTECKRVTYMPPDELHFRPTSVGRGMPNQEFFLVDEEGTRLEYGNTGELVVRGSHVMRGYWNKPEATDKRLKQGNYPGEVLLYTGDIFQTDEDGYLYFVGRKDDIIKSRGEKVSPKEVENVLYSIEGIRDAAVIGVEDPLLGEAVKGFITLMPGYNYSEKEILKYCMSKMENFMVPKYIEIVSDLPKTNTGKIKKTALK